MLDKNKKKILTKVEKNSPQFIKIYNKQLALNENKVVDFIFVKRELS